DGGRSTLVLYCRGRSGEQFSDRAGPRPSHRWRWPVGFCSWFGVRGFISLSCEFVVSRAGASGCNGVSAVARDLTANARVRLLRQANTTEPPRKETVTMPRIFRL